MGTNLCQNSLMRLTPVVDCEDVNPKAVFLEVSDLEIQYNLVIYFLHKAKLVI